MMLYLHEDTGSVTILLAAFNDLKWMMKRRAKPKGITEDIIYNMS
jgi:hypothetical protein